MLKRDVIHNTRSA